MRTPEFRRCHPYLPYCVLNMESCLESLVYICQYTEPYIPQATKLLTSTGRARTHATIRQPLIAEA